MESGLQFILITVVLIALVLFATAWFQANKQLSHKTDTLLGGSVFDISTAQAAQRIINGSLPHDETYVLSGGSVAFNLQMELLYDARSSEYTADIDVFPKATNIMDWLVYYILVGMVGRFARLQVRIGQQTNNTVYFKYIWTGHEKAIQKPSTVEYKIMHYLTNRLEQEFLARGYRKIGRSQAPAGHPNTTLHFEMNEEATVQKRQARAQLNKQWWRSYVASAQGIKDYPFWPNPQDYSEAVQAPQISFMDEDLKTSSVAMNILGIPKVASGMFASVYQFSKEHEQWAVRCFNTKLIDQHERYKAISKFILADDLTYTVDFNYIEDGIKVNGHWFPILKMNWVDGITLEAYIERNLDQPHVLAHLREQFETMMTKLRANSIAHGDLQHGNIMVSHDELYLVDYDGFFVPELKGRFSNELGHPNYQHPGRRDRHFGEYLDNFSAHVIDLTLLILIEDPALWQRFRGGDECLLFRKADYVDPENSALFKALSSSESKPIQAAAVTLKRLLRLELEDIPFLEAEATAVKIEVKETKPA